MLNITEDTINKAVDFICKFEGFSPTPYICPAGYRTIGYGRLLTVDSECSRTTQEDEKKWVKKQVNIIFKTLHSLPAKLSTPNQYIALSSFIYNLGIEKFNHSTLLKKLLLIPQQDPSYKKEITKQWLRWCHAKGKVLPGLQKRRQEEVNLFFT